MGSLSHSNQSANCDLARMPARFDDDLRAISIGGSLISTECKYNCDVCSTSMTSDCNVSFDTKELTIIS